MKRLVWVGVGAAAGYVFGTRAGRAQYERFRQGVERVWGNVGGDQATRNVSDTLSDLTDTAQARVAGGVEAVSEKVASTVGAATDKIRPSAVDLTQEGDHARSATTMNSL